HNPPRRRHHALAMALTLATASGALLAQPKLEEVIVTAQKRSESLQETPISLAVFDNSSIQRLGITNIADIRNRVPNLSIVPFGVSPTTLRVYIRGIGTVDSQITQDPPVGIYLDGVYMARNSGLAMDVADIERIEVLRGPQGTLYGRNTTGGAISIVSRRPSDKLEFSQLVTLGDYDQVRSKTTLNVPLGERFAAKLAYEYHERDGWIENSGAGADFHAYDKRAARVDLRWKPADAVTVDYAYDRSESDFTGGYYHLNEVSAGFAGVLQPQPKRVNKATLALPYQTSDEDTEGHAFTVAIDTALGEFTSITAYRELAQNAYQDYSANPTIAIFINDPFTLEQDQWSQEFQLVGSTDNGRFDYVAGLYYFSEKGREDAVDKVAIAALDLPRRIDIENEAWAVYGQATWHPDANSPWAFTLGGRYTRDERDADNHIASPASASFTNFTPSFTAAYQVNDNVSVYGKVVTGYKSGGFNLRQANFSQNFDEETLISYELGWKSELMERRLRFNGAVFYADYDDIQLDILVPGGGPVDTVTENAGKAEILGLEMDLTWAISETLRGSLSYGYLDSDVKKVAGDDASLYKLPNSPKHSYTVSLNWDVMRLALGTVDLGVDYAWRDDTQTGVRELVGIDIDAYGVANAQLSLNGEDWFGKGDYRVALWVKNAFDEAYFSDTFGSFNGIHANRIATYGDPRTYGVDLEYRFY
ncbi:MAG: TonB-dependent receptor, partial [Spongiibacteraceae bacterium]|nr:TonB-dependent receptor [Spongiibacteraceae bacterium]